MRKSDATRLRSGHLTFEWRERHAQPGERRGDAAPLEIEGWLLETDGATRDIPRDAIQPHLDGEQVRRLRDHGCAHTTEVQILQRHGAGDVQPPGSGETNLRPDDR